jgi:hypothetical protein
MNHVTHKQRIQTTKRFGLMHTLHQFLFFLLRYPFYLGASVKALDEATTTITRVPDNMGQ